MGAWTRAAMLTALMVCWGANLAQAQERYGNDLGPEPAEEWEGEVDYAATAGTLLTCETSILGSACTAIPTSTAEMTGVPTTRRVLRAYLVWSASKEYLTPSDLEVNLTLPGGDPTPIIAAEDDQETIDLNDIVVPLLGTYEASWFTARADITDLINAHVDGGGDLNGTYEVGDLNIAHGDPNDLLNPSIWILGSLAVGGWSIVMVYEPETSTGFRKLYYYTGFEWLSGGALTLTPSGFIVPGQPNARFTVHVLEGDGNLQGDSMSFNGTGLTDACNPGNNAFNDTVNTNTGGQCRQNVFGVDLDTYVVGELLEPGDEDAEVSFSVPNEQIFTNYLMMAFDSVPEFIKPTKLADPPSNQPVAIGDTITYTIAIENRGTGPASQVILTDGVPPGTRYIPNSTVVDDNLPVSDPMQGVSPLVDGLLLDPIIGGPIPHIGEDSRHRVTFQVEVVEIPESGAVINEATIEAQGIDPVPTNLTNHRVMGDDPPDMDAGMEPDANPDPNPGMEPDANPDVGEPMEDVPEPDPNPSPNPDPNPDMPDVGEEPQPDPFMPNNCGPGTTIKDGVCVPICGPGTSFQDGICVANGGNTVDDGCGCALPAAPSPSFPWPLALIGLLALGIARRR